MSSAKPFCSEDVDMFNLLGSMFVVMVKASKRSDARLILPDPYSIACNPAIGRALKYRCIQREELTRLFRILLFPIRAADERMLVVFYILPHSTREAQRLCTNY